MKTFTVVLPIEVDGKTYQSGATVTLDEVNAELYSHALRAEAPAPNAATAGAAKFNDKVEEINSGRHS